MIRSGHLMPLHRKGFEEKRDPACSWENAVERIYQIERDEENRMNTGAVGWEGYAPDVKEAIDERYKYEQMWQHDEYRVVAPGEDVVNEFLAQAKPRKDATVIDFGAGTGRGAIALALFGCLKVKMVDFASNCLDPFVRDALKTQDHALSFTQHDLTLPFPTDFTAEYGYCTDVMEHIPPHQVDQVLANVLHTAQHVFFQISCVDDVCGKIIGHPLHLSVHPYEWWLKKLQQFDAVVHWSQDCQSHCMFYVSAWLQGKDFVNAGVLNTGEEELLANVKTNVANGWKQALPHQANDIEVAILAGGPSLNEHLDEIQYLKSQGAKIVTLNGAYNWAQAHDLWPVSTIVVDAREFNKRFTHPVDERNLYLIASQCHPMLLDGLPKERTFLWHTNVNAIREILDAQYEQWYNTPGGTTVLLRAIPLLRMLGYRRFHLFGADSCVRTRSEDNSVYAEHHAYTQIENDRDLVVPVTCGDRIFQCHPWQIAQATEFMGLVKVFGDEVELEIYGDGLLAHIVNTGAKLAVENEQGLLV